MTVIVGIPIPSSSPYFLAGVAVHVAFGLTCVACGAVAMLSSKRPGRHPTAGSLYVWALSGVFLTASSLALARWREDRVLFFLAALSFGLAIVGRQARRRAWRDWPRWHMSGMGLSYIVMLTAFYVDNGKILPVWRDLPPLTYWLAPGLVGLPILAIAFFRHPLVSSRPSLRS
ncbi:MAG TPA: hypothetical protein VKQ70_08670 [Caulobacteraceae bacterium]|jgi:hypothetical protein|nr:hypothetical protein [Caulobacteraceae bacterium]